VDSKEYPISKNRYVVFHKPYFPKKEFTISIGDKTNASSAKKYPKNPGPLKIEEFWPPQYGGNGPLKPNDERSSIIVQMQKMLTDVGYEIPANENGKYGPKTAEAIDNELPDNPLGPFGAAKALFLNMLMVGIWYDSLQLNFKNILGVIDYNALWIGVTTQKLRQGITIKPGFWNRAFLFVVNDSSNEFLFNDPFDTSIKFEEKFEYKIYDKDNKILKEGFAKNEKEISYDGGAKPFKVKIKIGKKIKTFFF